MIPLPWIDPVEALRPFADEPWAVLLLSHGARWSYLARCPAATEWVAHGDADRDFSRLRALLGPRAPHRPGAPPFAGGVIGLVSYEFADRLEPLGLPRDPDWPDLILADYPAVLAFDHGLERVIAAGRTAADAQAAASWLNHLSHANEREGPRLPPEHLSHREREGPIAEQWEGEGLECQQGNPSPPHALNGRGSPPLPMGEEDFPAACFARETPARAYEAAVADVVARIAAGEIFQANIAAAWRGSLAPGASPFDVFARLQAQSPAPYCAYWRLPGLALVSHSPERFVSLDAGGVVETRPIKGTVPRGEDVLGDARQKARLLASAKDRAENLMIVDLMRNDISRVCAPGSVHVPDLFAVESYASVHHLVSTVAGVLAAGRDGADLLAAAFPPGSITGAPKVQAMRVIAAHEGPRGPWCGALFWAGRDGALDSSVLIRTAAFTAEADGAWRYAARAGAGIVADSDPAAERRETEVKIAGLKRALTGQDG